ncbi:MAG: hypothetical protein AAF541_08215 [Pseudomonadota bacterium]
MLARILVGLIGLLMLMNGVNWLVDPGATAASLGMPLLEGVGRSTQIGDMSSFFLSCAGFCLYSAWKESAAWAYPAAILLGLTAITRTIAWAAHGADFATVFIVVEIASAAVLVFGAIQFTKRAQA